MWNKWNPKTPWNVQRNNKTKEIQTTELKKLVVSLHTMVILARYYYYFYLLIGNEQKLRGQRTTVEAIVAATVAVAARLLFLLCYTRTLNVYHSSFVFRFIWAYRIAHTLRSSGVCRVLRWVPCNVCVWARAVFLLENGATILHFHCTFPFIFSVCLFARSQQSDGGAKCRWKLNNAYTVRCGVVTTYDFLCFCSQFYAAPRKLSEADMKNKNNRAVCRDNSYAFWVFFHSHLHRNFLVHSKHIQMVGAACIQPRYLFASVPAYIQRPYVISIELLHITIGCCCCFLSCVESWTRNTRDLLKKLWIFLLCFFFLLFLFI